MSEFSHWSVWIEDDDVRVTRDWLNAPAPRWHVQPQHLALDDSTGYLVWKTHSPGDSIPSFSLLTFVAWLDQGGANA